MHVSKDDNEDSYDALIAKLENEEATLGDCVALFELLAKQMKGSQPVPPSVWNSVANAAALVAKKLDHPDRAKVTGIIAKIGNKTICGADLETLATLGRGAANYVKGHATAAKDAVALGASMVEGVSPDGGVVLKGGRVVSPAPPRPRMGAK